ncbi:MAG: LysR family transcriptional regulator [Verrucomicrobiaceae bacterium]|nr:MAG: LysR family transcriptional regulator [Verrucomicrobiaceae bacterium]
MNIHHLELFYYVAKHGGVSAAARHIPYGIQQPAISAQVIQLEDDLGTTLFQRRPFKLTAAGEELLRFIEPFFGGLDAIGKKLRGGAEVRVRIGAPAQIQRDYLPRLLKAARAKHPELTFTFFSGGLEQIEAQLLAQEIDIGLAPLHGKRPEGIKQQEMVRLPLQLLVHESSNWSSAEDLWGLDRIQEPLVTLASHEPMCRLFMEELGRRKVEWFPSLELSSLELVARYVAEEFGIGLMVCPPEAPMPPNTRLLQLPGFPEVPFGALWSGRITPAQQALLEEAQKVASAMVC